MHLEQIREMVWNFPELFYSSYNFKHLLISYRHKSPSFRYIHVYAGHFQYW